MSKKQYSVYRTTNLINGKVYIGFHSISDNESIIVSESINGSIFKSGYLGSGKLIRDAIRKYGPDNFKQELLLLTIDKSEAEELERRLVDRTFVESDDTYNLSLGGNVTILYGSNNGFYGKRHSKETIEKIQTSRNKTLESNRFSFSEFLYLPTKTIYYCREEFIEDVLNTDLYSSKAELLREIDKLVSDGEIVFKSTFLQNLAIERHQNELNRLAKQEHFKVKRSKECSERFKGVPKTKESNLKRGTSIKRWIHENQDLHQARMNKINKNPEKIAKTAATHRGMKRPLITRYRLTIAKLKNNIKVLNSKSGKSEWIERKKYSMLSDGEKMIYQVLNYAVYYNTTTDTLRLFFDIDVIPESYDYVITEENNEIIYRSVHENL